MAVTAIITRIARRALSQQSDVEGAGGEGRSFVPQRRHRIDARRAFGRHQARGESDDGERHGRQREWRLPVYLVLRSDQRWVDEDARSFSNSSTVARRSG